MKLPVALADSSRAVGPRGLLIHGFELEGSSELAPGTRIYQGGGPGFFDGHFWVQ